MGKCAELTPDTLEYARLQREFNKLENAGWPRWRLDKWMRQAAKRWQFSRSGNPSKQVSFYNPKTKVLLQGYNELVDHYVKTYLRKQHKKDAKAERRPADPEPDLETELHRILQRVTAEQFFKVVAKSSLPEAGAAPRTAPGTAATSVVELSS